MTQNFQQDHELSWDDTIQNDSTDPVVLEPGDYIFEVEKFERARYTPGPNSKLPACNMAKLTLKIASEKGTAIVFNNLYLHTSTELGCAVIYCHHHSKGSQGGKNSMDRSSGSGVFARDPDAILDLIELPLTEERHTYLEDKAVCELYQNTIKKYNQSYEISQDDIFSKKQMEHHLMSAIQSQEILKQTELERKNVVRAARQCI
ncbi:hypothetical protein [Enterococcus thailandicus]|uniref:hypothetical protein n=1 Tax=Enterococcus thailandicus TaxID=417368 RepID=UPI0022E9143A|nr:hypothetical protein [Enterococcus thailandicus]